MWPHSSPTQYSIYIDISLSHSIQMFLPTHTVHYLDISPSPASKCDHMFPTTTPSILSRYIPCHQPPNVATNLFRNLAKWRTRGRASRNCRSAMAVRILLATYSGSIVGSLCPFFRARLSHTILVLMKSGQTQVTLTPDLPVARSSERSVSEKLRTAALEAE